MNALFRFLTIIFLAYATHMYLKSYDLTSGMEKNEPLQSDSSMPADDRIIVVGGGLSGLSATLEIVERGGKVVLIEKEAKLGGNSAKASSGMNAAESAVQAHLEIEDSVNNFLTDTVKSGNGLSDEHLVHTLVTNSASAVDFIMSYGVDLSAVSQLGGHSVARTHRNAPDGKLLNIGLRIIRGMIAAVETAKENGSVEILVDTKMVDLLEENGKVHGVRVMHPVPSVDGGDDVAYAETDITGRAVVLTTGGYCGDRSASGLLAENAPHLLDTPTTNGNWATGDGVKIGRAHGAAVKHLDQIQLHPTGFVDPKQPDSATKFLAPEALRGVGGILFNSVGERFVNELATRDSVATAIRAQVGPPVAYLMLNDDGIEAFDRTLAGFYQKKEMIVSFDNAALFAEAHGMPPETVVSALRTYELAAASEISDPFGKTVFPRVIRPDEPVFVATITPVLHYSMGGLAFDADGHVLRSDGSVISGLFAAGEVTGGLHGANRLGGNSLLECVVFGRIVAASVLS